MKQADKTRSFIKDPNALWTYRRIVSYLECPHLLTPEKKNIRQKIIEMYGINSPLVQSMSFGRFQSANQEYSVFDVGHINAIKMAMRGVGNPVSGQPSASIDFSGGGDKHSVIFGEGTRFDKIEDHSSPNEIAMAETLVTRFNAMGLQPFNVRVDGGGLGSTCIKYMERDLKFRGIKKYLNNRRPRNPKVFFDRYTEDHFRLRRLLALHGIILPQSEALLKQAKLRLYVMTSDMRIKMEPKEKLRAKGLRSPDILDALVMAITDVFLDQIDTTSDDEQGEKDKANFKTWEEQAEEQTKKSHRLGSLFTKPRKRSFPGKLSKSGTANSLFRKK